MTALSILLESYWNTFDASKWADTGALSILLESYWNLRISVGGGGEA